MSSLTIRQREVRAADDVTRSRSAFREKFRRVQQRTQLQTRDRVRPPAFSPRPSPSPKKRFPRRAVETPARSVAKSRLIRPVLEEHRPDSISRRGRSIRRHARKESSNRFVVGRLLQQTRRSAAESPASQTLRSACRPSSACFKRRPPSKLNGSVTNAITSAPDSAAISATVGDAPLARPAAHAGDEKHEVAIFHPPPAIFSRSASARLAAELRVAAGAEAARDAHADEHLVLDGENSRGPGSRLLITASCSRSRFSILSRSTALDPAPPMPTSLMATFAIG